MAVSEELECYNLQNEPIELVAFHPDRVVAAQLVCLVHTCHEEVVVTDVDWTRYSLDCAVL